MDVRVRQTGRTNPKHVLIWDDEIKVRHRHGSKKSQQAGKRLVQKCAKIATRSPKSLKKGKKICPEKNVCFKII